MTDSEQQRPTGGNTRGAPASPADSVVHFKNSSGIEARGTILHVTRTSIVFEVYNPYSIVQLSEVLQELRLSRNERVIYHGRAMVSNLVSTGLMLIVTAALVDPWRDLSGLISAESIRDETSRFIGDWEQHNQIRPSFQLAVTNTAGFLGELNRWLTGAEMALDNDANTGTGLFRAGEQPPLAGMQRDFVEQVSDAVSGKLADLFGRFEEESKAVAPEEQLVHKNFAQRLLHPLVLVSPWMHRCFSKPFGYAGDYEMLNMILRDPLNGPNAYARVLNSHILTTAPPIAYANRITMLMERLRTEAARVRRDLGRPMRAITIGCGPVNEIQRFLREDPTSQGCHFDLMDFNQPTIDFAHERMDVVIAETGRRVKVTYINKSIHELLKEARKGRAEGSPTYDLVYCAGLFDYLSDRVCGSLIRLFFSWLEPGGLVVVTNVANSEPIVASLEFLLEWYLIYRQQADMLRLTPATGRQSVDVDGTGINMFLDVRKPLAEA